MKFVDCPNLYYSTSQCAELFEQFNAVGAERPAGPIPVHFIWFGPFGNKQRTAIKSFIATQEIQHFTPILWVDTDAVDLGDLVGWVEIRRYDPVALAAGTPVAGLSELTDGTPAQRSNFARLLILHRWGGLYADLDIIFIRNLFDLAPLRKGQSFTNQWSREPYCNNALISLSKDLAHELLLRASSEKSGSGWKILRFDAPDDLDLLVLPCGIFDPLWTAFDGADERLRLPFRSFGDFFRPFGMLHKKLPQVQSAADLFPWAYTYHWHNHWDVATTPNSYFGVCAREIDRLFARKHQTSKKQHA